MLCLGLSATSDHDTSAAITVDGKVVFAIAEERLSKKKHDGSFPSKAIKACLDHVGAGIADVDIVASGWPRYTSLVKTEWGHVLQGRDTRSIGTAVRDIGLDYVRLRSLSVERALKRDFGVCARKAEHFDHHFAHAVSAFSVSGMDEAAVVVIDGRGAWEATSIWHGRAGNISHVETVRWPNSLGLFYAEFTGFLGFAKYQDEWKVMGLAPYGARGIDLSDFIRITDDGYEVNYKRLLHGALLKDPFAREQLGGPRDPSDELTDRHKALAFAVQDACERAEINVVKRATRLTGSRNLCLAGGVGLNSKANGLFLREGLIDRIFVQPAASDDGVSLGAALAASRKNGKIPQSTMVHPYLGSASSDREIEDALNVYKLRFERLSDPAGMAADLLADGKLVGWFQGREEFGPRALGNRSILADPRDVKNRDRVNSAVKFREEWRPFAPSVIHDVCDEYFQHYHPSPFMTLTFMVRPEKREKISAAVHIDGSARVQSVTREQNALYYELLEKFGAKTGVPAVLNTSFNLKGETIVNSPFDAIRTFYTSGLDALIMGHFLLRK